VGFVDGVSACGGGIKSLGDGNAELKRMYVAPQFRGRGLGRALLLALENAARELGHRAVRLDSQSSTWPMYLAAGYREVADYNDNPHADFWGEKQL
jgi:GNAT superfamily N-acetyltransferase